MAKYPVGSVGTIARKAILAYAVQVRTWSVVASRVPTTRTCDPASPMPTGACWLGCEDLVGLGTWQAALQNT
jgi:hypothetical protein